MLSYYELTGEERALSFLRRFFKNQFNTLDVTPLWADARARLPEEVPAIAAVYRESEAGWLKDLAVKLCSLSCNWVGIANKFPYKKPAERSVSARALKKAVRTVRAAEGERRADGRNCSRKRTPKPNGNVPPTALWWKQTG